MIIPALLLSQGCANTERGSVWRSLGHVRDTVDLKCAGRGTSSSQAAVGGPLPHHRADASQRESGQRQSETAVFHADGELAPKSATQGQSGSFSHPRGLQRVDLGPFRGGETSPAGCGDCGQSLQV